MPPDYEHKPQQSPALVKPTKAKAKAVKPIKPRLAWRCIDYGKINSDKGYFIQPNSAVPVLCFDLSPASLEAVRLKAENTLHANCENPSMAIIAGEVLKALGLLPLAGRKSRKKA